MKGRGVNGGHQVRYVYVLVLVVEEKDASEALIRMMRVAIADDGPLLGIFLPGPSRYIKGMADGSLHEGRALEAFSSARSPIRSEKYQLLYTRFSACDHSIMKTWILLWKVV